MAHIGDSLHPGQGSRVGPYECDAGDSHRFPPLPDGCKGRGQVLKNTTAAAEALHGVSKVVPGVETSKDS